MSRYIPIVKCREGARDRKSGEANLEGYRDFHIRSFPNRKATQLEGWGG